MSLKALVSSVWTPCPAPGATAWAACAVPPVSTWIECGSVPPPTITQLAPAYGYQNTLVHLTIRGENFVPGAVVSVSGTGITIANAVVVDAATITCDLTLASNATVSSRTVTVTTPSGAAGATFKVFAALVPIPTAGLSVWVEADFGFDGFVDGQVPVTVKNRGTAGDLVVPGGVTAPQWKSGLFGGKPCLSFNNANAMVTPSGMTMGSFAAFVVGYMSSNQNLHIFYQFTDGVAITNFFGYGAPAIIVLKPAGTSSSGVLGSPIAKDKQKLWRHRFVDTHASHQLYENGGLVALADQSAGNPGAAVSAAGVLTMGSNSGLNNTLLGYIAALLVFSPIPSDADIATIEAYLTAKWPLQ